MDLSVLYQVSYGMYIAAVKYKGKDTGCVINTVMQVTSENPIIAVCLNRDNYTYEAIKSEGKFSLSILSENTDPSLISVFGFQSGRDTDKFSGMAHEHIGEVPVIRKDSCGILLCEVISVSDIETHSVIYARLTYTEKGEETAPMTYAYYHKVVKGKAPKNAPTYQEATTSEKGEAYVCTVCGYVYHGDITKEPDDYKCPICGKDKSFFKKM